jgi:PAS domain S-box-containing protein
MSNLPRRKGAERTPARLPSLVPPSPELDPGEAEERYRKLVELSPDAITVHKQGRIVFANPAAARLLGARSAKELTGRSILEFVHVDSRPGVLERLERLRQGYAVPPVEERFVRLDGASVEVDVAAAPMTHAGEPAVQVVARDITERKRVERKLRDAEAKYRALVEQIPAITYTDLVDEPMTTVYISPQIEPILGFTPDEYCGDPELWYKQLHPQDREHALSTYLRGRAGGEPFAYEYRMIARDGRVVWFRDDAVVLRDENGDPSLIHGVMFDITQRKQMETDLERALRTERDAAERLRALDDLKNTFLHAVSHELRTPLSSVLGYALTLEREDLGLTARERLEITRRLAANARKLEQLLTDLLDLDRLDRGIVEPQRRPTDIAALVRRTVEGSEILGARPVRVEADLVVVAVDGSKVERIVENLLANAAKHTPAGTTIWVRVAPEPGGVLIAVEDDGPGVAEALRDRIFEPFSRGPDAPQHSPGVGIGLSLVARFAELHGGRAWVTDRPGGGASFRVYLPGQAS